MPYRNQQDADPYAGDSTGVFIPYRNPKALMSYYLGLFSIFPIFGLVLAIMAFVTGRQGLALAREHPEARGKTHAYVGIGCGAFGLILNVFLVILFAGAAISALVTRH